MVRTSSLNCLSCRNPFQTRHSLNASPFSLKSALSHPLPQNPLLLALRQDGTWRQCLQSSFIHAAWFGVATGRSVRVLFNAAACWPSWLGESQRNTSRNECPNTGKFFNSRSDGQCLSVLWSLRPRNRAAAATCGHGRCELPAISRVTQKSLAASVFFFFAAAEAKNPAISAAEWLRARLRPPWSLRFCDASFVPPRSVPLGLKILPTQLLFQTNSFR